MRRLWLSKLLAVLTATGLIAVASPAWALSTIPINPGNVPTTAVGFGNPECSANLGGGPFAGQDVWVFNLPGNTATFVAVTAQFTTPGGPVTKVIPTDGGAIVQIGTSKAWIVLPAGWTLTGASAEITGSDTQFVLTHTCPATTSTPSPGPSPTPSPSGSTPPSPDPSGSASPSASTGVSPSASSSQPPLPRTGAPIISLFVTGLTALTIGTGLLLIMHRRRNMTFLED